MIALARGECSLYAPCPYLSHKLLSVTSLWAEQFAALKPIGVKAKLQQSKASEKKILRHWHDDIWKQYMKAWRQQWRLEDGSSPLWHRCRWCFDKFNWHMFKCRGGTHKHTNTHRCTTYSSIQNRCRLVGNKAHWYSIFPLILVLTQHLLCNICTN